MLVKYFLNFYLKNIFFIQEKELPVDYKLLFIQNEPIL
ncbi:hypothetical protein SMSK564_0321 [Streptococcus mitis SK564]|uniref:Uncharacterized protein n=1 Tax=Streptococcus mitis SK564 TaxID=585203 RepID=E1LKE4_STRMT|nr:hypothetical protein SMSK564_0321 [Streptococcus mitis SK564]